MKERVFVALLALLPACPALANDALLDEALARPAQPKDIGGFILNTNTLSGGNEPEVEHERIDLKAKPDEAFASYDELKGVIGTKAELVSSEGGRSQYRFRTRQVPQGTQQPKGVKIQDDDDDMEFDGTADVVRDGRGKPYVSHLQLHMRHATGPLIGRIKAMELAYGFTPSADGATMVATDATANVNIRALFFMHRQFSLVSQWVPSEGAVVRAPPSE
jgi:hypothetical protein